MVVFVVILVAVVIATLVLVAHRKRQAVLLEMRTIAERIDAKLRGKP